MGVTAASLMAKNQHELDTLEARRQILWRISILGPAQTKPEASVGGREGAFVSVWPVVVRLEEGVCGLARPRPPRPVVSLAEGQTTVAPLKREKGKNKK